jgi:hypothetical protein
MEAATQPREPVMGLTFEQVWALFQETDKQFKETDRVLKEMSQETDRKIKERSQETDRVLKEMSQETDRVLKERSQETDRRFQETDRVLKEMSQETDRRSQETDRKIKEVSQIIGKLGNKIGELIEQAMSSGIVDKFNAFGYVFTRANRRVTFKNGSNKTIAEVDILLENGEFALAVEVKTDLKVEDVKEHIERMAVIRGYADARRDTRKFVGAVAGGIISEQTMHFALKSGFYVLEFSEDTVSIKTAPAPWQPRLW